MKILKIILLIFVLSLSNCVIEKTPVEISEKEPDSKNYWERIENFPPELVYEIVITPTDVIYTAGASGIHRQTKRGESWTNINNIGVLTCLEVNSGNIYTSSFSGQWGWIQYSTDDGITWLNPDSFPSNPLISSISFLPPGTVYVGSYETDESSGGLFYSEDNGRTWETTDIDSDISVWAIVANSQAHLFAGTTESMGNVNYFGIHKSTDKGQNWQFIELPELGNSYVRSLYADPSDNLYAGTNRSGLYKSVDDGESWENIGLQDVSVEGIMTDSMNTIFVMTYENILYSTNWGENWNEFSSGLPDEYYFSLVKDSHDYLYVSTETNGLFRTRLPILSLID